MEQDDIQLVQLHIIEEQEQQIEIESLDENRFSDYPDNHKYYQKEY
jgi:hypothetical protein